MRAALVLALALSLAPVAGAAGVDPADTWRPMFWFLGAWKGTAVGADGPVKLRRVYAAAPDNHHLQITETSRGQAQPAVWGIVSLDTSRQVLVLQQFAAQGPVADAVLDPPATPTGAFVFANAESAATRTRITDTRAGERAFVERVERSVGGGAFALVSETRFERTE